MTLTTVIACLMVLRQSAILLFGIVVLPVSIFLVLQNEQIYTASAVNLVLVIGAMIFVMAQANQLFQNGVEKQRKLNEVYKEARKIAQSDSLTGLANRRHFFLTVLPKSWHHIRHED